MSHSQLITFLFEKKILLVLLNILITLKFLNMVECSRHTPFIHFQFFFHDDLVLNQKGAVYAVAYSILVSYERRGGDCWSLEMCGRNSLHTLCAYKW